MRRILLFPALTAAAVLAAAEVKQAVIDFEAMPEGDPPPREIMVVEGDIHVKALPEGKVLEIAPSEQIAEASALLGAGAKGGASMAARVLATKSGRSFPRFGIGVHGQTGYRLYVVPAKKELQLVKGSAAVKAVPFDWTSGKWTHLKLEVRSTGGTLWKVTAKAWSEAEAEPKEPQITHEDADLGGLGRCSVWGTPYAGTPIEFDDVHVSVETVGS